MLMDTSISIITQVKTKGKRMKQNNSYHLFVIESEFSSTCLEKHGSETIRESKTMIGVMKRTKPNGTIQSCLFVGWYLCSHHPRTQPPTMLVNMDVNKVTMYGSFEIHLLFL